MKQYRTPLFIAIASVALITVLVIQVQWILQTAQARERLFNEKAQTVLARTTDALISDKETWSKIEACAGNDTAQQPITTIGRHEIHTIDSLFNHYMNFYNFHIAYSFEFVKQNSPPPKNNNFYPDPEGCYKQSLADMTRKTGVELKLIFPLKKQFIVAEMKTLFITSVILILGVLLLFWLTIRALLHEKQIAEYTSEFLNNTTHEFKTPLTNIALAGRLVLKDATLKMDDKIRHYAEIIIEENEKLGQQVEQVLSMTALVKGETPFQQTALDFHQLIHDAMKRMHLQLENKEGSFKTVLAAQRTVVIGDRAHLTNALCNLVDNAIKYSLHKPEITIETTDNKQNLIVTVSDKGIGLDKAHQHKVFDKFYRVPTGDVHDVKGFGLGLAYVKKIIELHKGTILINSEKGKGTTFTIELAHA